jgi:transposase
MNNNCNLQLEKWKALICKPSTLIIGIDVSKLKHDACFGTRDKIYLRKFPFVNNLQGFNAFIKMINKISVERKIKKILIGVEPTSIYWYPLFEFLSALGYKVCLVDTTSVYHNRKTMKKDNGKSDPKDAYSIQDLMVQKKFFFTVNTTKEGFAAKIAMKNWMTAQNALISSKTRMRTFLSLSFPELEIRIKKIEAQKVLSFFKIFPTPANIICHSEKEFIKEASSKLKRFKEIELKKIYSLAKTTVGVKLHLGMGELTMQKLIEDMRYQLEQEKNWFKHCNRIAQSDSGYERILAIGGIGPKIATGLILALGDYNSISNATQITKLAGLNLIDKTSGTSINGASRISHQGNDALRYWAFQAALQVIQESGPFKQLYERKQKNSPGKGSRKRALIAVGDKTIRVVWSILKKGGVYQKDYDKKIKEKYDE